MSTNHPGSDVQDRLFAGADADAVKGTGRTPGAAEGVGGGPTARSLGREATVEGVGGGPGAGSLGGEVAVEGVSGERGPVLGRVVGLDGLRGLAALYVVLFHCFLYSFPKFPRNTGPSWLGWMMYGRLAVVFFLMLSGFSLAIWAANHQWQLGGLMRFLRRRAWRILPPYWAALMFSLAVAWVIVPASSAGPPTDKTVVVFGLLLQDLVTAPTPNGAFWSIAIEAELYLAFPLMLLIRRRLGALALLAAVTLPVVVSGVLAEGSNPIEGQNGLTPNLAPVFAIGLVAAGVIAAPERIRRLPWHWLAGLAAAPVVLLIVSRGSVWTVTHYFWIDLALGPAMAMLLAAVATGRPRSLMRLLATRPVVSLGSFSYSLYLVHLPVVLVVSRRIARPHLDSRLAEFWLTLGLAVPLSLMAAWVFAQLFELPFQRHRSFDALCDAIRTPECMSARSPLSPERLRSKAEVGG